MDFHRDKLRWCGVDYRRLDDDCSIGAWRDGQALEMRFSDRLQPYCLPDAGGPRIENAHWILLPVLLPARDVAVCRRILGADNDHVVASQLAGDVAAERRVAALMPKD